MRFYELLCLTLAAVFYLKTKIAAWSGQNGLWRRQNARQDRALER
jgi:hypothetical protein